jgi:hypothetical protein
VQEGIDDLDAMTRVPAGRYVAGGDSEARRYPEEDEQEVGRPPVT